MKRRKLDPDLRRIIDREEWLEALRKMYEGEKRENNASSDTHRARA